MRATTARALRRFSHQAGHAQATGRLGAACMRCTANRARPGQPAAAPGGAHPAVAGVRLLVVEDNALNRRRRRAVEQRGRPGGLADGGLAGVQQVLEASVPFDAVLMDMQMPDIDGLEATRRIRADGRFAGLPILAMTANASLADREAAWRRHERPCGEADRQGAPGALPARSSRQERRQGRAGNGSGRGRTGRGAGRYRRAFRRQPGADRPGVAALRSGHAGPLRPARTPARRGRCPGQRRDPAYHQGQRFHRWRQRPAGRASELEQALRRADRLRGMEILAGIRLDELRTLCDACLLRLQAMFGDVQAESAS